jgi:two-component system nitrate/nitrite sensor histidine kinase NarX
MEVRNRQYPLSLTATTKQSLLLRLGIAMATIVLLAVVGTISSVFMAETSEGFAAAINQAGTLRMQSYRISSSLVQPGKTGTQEAAHITQRLVAEYEQRLYNPRIHDVLSKEASPEVQATYRAVEDEWENSMQPIMSEYVGRALGGDVDARTDARLQDLKAAYLGKVDGFVDLIHAFVRALEDEAEGKIRQLRLIQIVVLILTFIVVAVILYFGKKDVLVPLRDLLTFAKAVRGGDFSIRSNPRREDELGQLGYAFNLMAEDLSKIYADLEKRVEEKTADLEQSNRSLELLYSIAKQLAENPITEGSLDNLIGNIQRLIGIKGGAVCLGVPGDKQAFRMAMTMQDQMNMAAECEKPDCMRCFGDGDAHEFTLETGDGHVEGRFSVPIRDQSQQYGILLVGLPEGMELEDWQRRLLETVASHIAMAINRSRQSSRNRMLSLLEERSVIARELHDSLAQSLSYLKIQVSLLEKTLDLSKDDKVYEITNKLRNGLNSAYRELRELLTTFRLGMSEEGLARAIEDTVREFNERGNVEVSLENRIANCVFSPNEEIHTIQIVREALSNIVQHASASKANVSMHCDLDGEVTIVIEDNGVGMPDINQLEHHYGLPIMRERAQGLNGVLHIGPSSLGGTAVKLNFHASPSSLG